MKQRVFLLCCGYFPEMLRDRVNAHARERCTWAHICDRTVLSDLPVWDLAAGWGVERPDTVLGRTFWLGFGGDEDYYTALIGPGDEVYAFAYARDPAHRDRLTLLDALCAEVGAVLRLKLF